MNDAASWAMCLATGSVPSMVLKAALELNILEIMKKAGPQAQLSAGEIAAQLPTTNPNAAVVLDRMLRLLASFSVMTFSVRNGTSGQPERVYGLGPACEFLTQNEDGVSFAAFALLIQDKVIMETWNNLKDAVLVEDKSVPFVNAHGMNIFEYLGKDWRFREVFYNGMKHHSIIVSKKILETYQGFQGISSLVDVGGATGETLKMIVSKYPNIKATNFDLPHVIDKAPSYPGVEHVAGDMYVSIPNADAIFMKWTFHTAGDEQCVRLLKNCYAALPEHGKVIVCEYIVPDLPENSYSANTAFVFDAIMLAVPGGKERTKQEYEALGKEAGFQGFQVLSEACDTWIMEFLK